MKTIFDIKLGENGYEGMSVHNDDIEQTKTGIDNPHAYRLSMLLELEYLIRTIFSKEDEFAIKMLDILQEIRDKENEKYKKSRQ